MYSDIIESLNEAATLLEEESRADEHEELERYMSDFGGDFTGKQRLAIAEVRRAKGPVEALGLAKKFNNEGVKKGPGWHYVNRLDLLKQKVESDESRN